MLENDLNNSNKNKLSLKGLGFFVEKDYLVFIFKKTEKLATALYLVSAFFKDDEPLKWSLREKGMYLLSHALVVNDSDAFDRDHSLRSIFSTALELISLLSIAAQSRLISEMNHTILKREFEALVNRLREGLELETSGKGFILSDAFFETDTASSLPTDQTAATPYIPQSLLNKGHEKKNSGFFSSHTPSPHRHMAPKTQGLQHTSANSKDVSIKDKKNDRKEKILTLLSKGGALSVKDFTKVISNCSEKTIQRELLDLVEKGVLRKEGERRWSRYSLPR